jgi:2-oxoglutarate ferredoxin oxidoreductase subunit alpha
MNQRGFQLPKMLESAQTIEESMKKIVNDFSITVGTVNGSGSSTANNTILRAIFKMGIPVSGKNLFPSNIQGQPTWYTIRVNKDGYTGRNEAREIVVAINPASFARDLESVAPGGAFFYADDIKQAIPRSDITTYAMPIKQLIREQKEVPSKLYDLVGNMVYVGILAQVIGMDLEKVHTALDFHFKHREKPTMMNFNAVKAGADWAKANLTKHDPFALEPMTKTDGLIMADGNTAAALGAIYGGVQFAGWYPITPATGLAESLNDYLPQLRKREDGKHTYAIVQAEDELAALGMSIGAGWGGLRSMTSTSGPGLSLMTEFAGLAYYAEVPVVIWDVQRIGPSTGLPTRTSQGDLTFAAFIGHGDSQSVILLPGDAFECFEFGWKALDLAERLQTPIFVLSDLDIGMNQWMSKPFEYPSTPMDRGKVLSEADIAELKGNWGRYLDKDGDGIPYRTLPGNRQINAAYFTRGTGHDEYARYSEEAPVFTRVLDRLKKKQETAKSYVPAPIVHETRGAEVGIIAYGSTESAVREAIAQLAVTGLKSSLMRIRAMPFTKEVDKFIKKYEMYQLLCVDYPALAPKLRSVAFQDGLPASAKWIKEGILANVKDENGRTLAPHASAGVKDEVKKKTVKKSVKKPPVKKQPVKKASAKKGAKK